MRDPIGEIKRPELGRREIGVEANYTIIADCVGQCSKGKPKKL